MRLAVVTSHPIQYNAPLFRALAQELDVHVFFAHRATARDQAKAGFDTPFTWDVDLLSGYQSSFLTNISRTPSADFFSGCDTPEVARCLRDGRFNAVLVFGWYLRSFVQTVVAARRLQIPILVRGDSHLGTPVSSWKRAAKRFVYP